MGLGTGDLAAVRRGIVAGGVAVLFSQLAFGTVYGFGARDAGLSLVEALAMSALAYSGSAQFASLGLIASGVPWAGIVLLTGLLNLRHVLYSASLAPWFSGVPRRTRAIAAHALTDEVFAVTLPAFQRLGRVDLPGYAIAAALTLPAWVLATLAGYLGGQLIPSPRALGLDVVFPAVMAGLAVALVTDRRAATAALTGATVGVAGSLLLGTTAGVIAGAVAGPLAAMAARPRPAEVPESDIVPPPDGMPG